MIKIWAHTLTLNEDKFIWFALASVVDQVDKILVWDTGSDDKTVAVIKEFQKKYPGKVGFKEIGKITAEQLPQLRQQMLEASRCDWILVLDGDEVWLDESIKKVTSLLRTTNEKLDGVVVPFHNLIGDIYHQQPESAGRYSIMGKTGHLQLKFISTKIPGLHVTGVYPLEGYRDHHNRLIQESPRLKYVEAPYLHLTHLPRSSKPRRYDKRKLEIGERLPTDFIYPSAFKQAFPEFVESPFWHLSGLNLLLACLLTPVRKMKRILYG